MPDKLAALIARWLEAAESGPWQSRDVYADCAKVLAETLADEEPQPERTCVTCKWWSRNEHRRWGSCASADAYAGVYPSSPDMREDFGCIYHERKEVANG